MNCLYDRHVNTLSCRHAGNVAIYLTGMSRWRSEYLYDKPVSMVSCRHAGNVAIYLTGMSV